MVPLNDGLLLWHKFKLQDTKPATDMPVLGREWLGI